MPTDGVNLAAQWTSAQELVRTPNRVACRSGSTRRDDAARTPTSAVGGIGRDGGLRGRDRFALLAQFSEAGVEDYHGASKQDRGDRCRQARPSQGGCRRASITVDQDATEVANGTVARFHGSSVSGITTKTCRPGLPSRQPTAYAANRMRERAARAGR